MTTVGAMIGMEGSAFPTAKEPRPSAVGAGWLTDAESRLHFALSAHEQDGLSWGTLNVRLEGDEGAFWAKVDSLQIIAPDVALIEGTINKAEGVFEACDGDPFQVQAREGEQSTQRVDSLRGVCDAGRPFGGDLEQGNLRIDGPVRK